MEESMKCSRCGDSTQCLKYGTVYLCEACLILIIREWHVRQQEFGALTEAQR
jgi:predicted RNA-binding Zn-ribbon protein involved in translation (DUF1610 family)